MDLDIVLKEATKRLGEERAPLLQSLVQCGAVNLRWYLEEKIVRASDESFRDHERALKYAYNFCRRNGQVTFLKESIESGQKMPDLDVQADGFDFCVEVKKFREAPSIVRGDEAQGLVREISGDPVSKIVDVVSQKRAQLLDSRVGFVAIDNFDLRLESAGDAPTHDHLVGALNELQRLATENPAGWSKPGGVIISAMSAMSTGGVVTVVEGGRAGIGIPHLVWINGGGNPSAPHGLAEWLASALPGGEIFT